MRAHPKASIPTLKPSSTQEPTSSRARHTTQILQQHRNITLNFNIQAAQSHTKPINILKLTTGHIIALPDRRNPAPLTRKLTQASLTKKPWQATHPTSPTGRNLHNKEEPQTARIQKGHPKHRNLNKMKRQRNTQQIKEHDKCSPNQTKEKEIGNPPGKEFKIMIVKMIQNLENKMELQINSLETRIEKMQEKFNKDWEEIKKSQSIMNNAINEIKNTLEGTNSRITGRK